MVEVKINMHRNTVYGHPEWKKHKSSWRHMRHIFNIFSSGVIAALGPPVILSTLGAVFVSMINFGVRNKRFLSWVPLVEIAIEPFQLLSPVLALLLVFRTNASYQRFDEARKVWGSNVNRCRDLARQSLTWITVPDDKEKRQWILRYIKAYPYFLKHHLTQGASVADELLGILSQEELDAVCSAPNRPIYVLQVSYYSRDLCIGS